MKIVLKKQARTAMTCLLCLMALAVFSPGKPAQGLPGGKIEEFSADQVHLDPQGELIGTGKLYVTREKMRMDGMPPGPQGKNLVMIFHKKEKRQYILNTAEKRYYESPMDEKQMMQGLGSMKQAESERDLGTETVNGFKCTMKEITSTVEFMGIKRKSTLLIWVSKRLEMPLRTKTEDGTVAELRNIKKGAPEDSLFAIPRDYARAGTMMEVMGRGAPEESEMEGAARPAGPPLQLPESLKDFKLPEGLKGLPFGSKE